MPPPVGVALCALKDIKRPHFVLLVQGKRTPGSVDPEHSRAAAGFSSLQPRFVWNSLRLSGGVLL